MGNRNIRPLPRRCYNEEAYSKNVNFGLLEKGTNKSSKSFAFDSLRKALYYQQDVAGKVHKITGYDKNDR